MKRVKKFLFITAVVLVLLFAGAIQAYAASGLTFAVDSNVTGEKGGQITVPIRVSNNPGFSAVGLELTYNSNALELVDVRSASSGMPLSQYYQRTTTPGTQWISLVNDGVSDYTGNDTVVNVIFNVTSSAAAGQSNINLRFTSSPDGTPGNAAGNIIYNSSTVSGSVNITDSAATPPPAAATPPPAAEETQQPTYVQPDYTYDDIPAYDDIPTFEDIPELSGGVTISSTGAPAGVALLPSDFVMNASGGFGAVPQTGVFNSYGTFALICVILAAVLWVCAYIIKKGRLQNNEENETNNIKPVFGGKPDTVSGGKR